MRAVVTGAANGIGRAACRALVEAAHARGDSVQLVLVDLAADPLGQAAEEIRGLGGEARTCIQDVSADDAGERIAESAAMLGGLDALISNAGTFRSGPLLELSAADYDRTMAVNTRSAFLLAKACHPLLKQSAGAIVATASLSSEEVTPATGAYSTSKAALVMLIRQMALEWGPDGIRANCVSPGTIHTEMNQAVYAREGEAEKRGALLPLRRIGGPDDVARVISFLAGPDARYVTGANIRVDGGLGLSLMSHFWALAASTPVQPTTDRTKS